MRRPVALIVALACVGLLLAGTAGHGQPASGVSRPDFAGSKDERQLGQELFAANCATCHDTGRGPPLKGVGARSADFYLRTGYMPLGDPGEQPMRRKPLFSDREIRALVHHVGGLGEGPGVPVPHPERGRVPEGLRLFTEHCAGCHQVAARGGVVTGARVPALQDATAKQIAEAVRIGPYLMPRFSERQITPAQLNSIIAYVQSTHDPPDAGGWGLGNIGPVPEGMATWFLAMVALIATCVVIGRRGTRG